MTKKGGIELSLGAVIIVIGLIVELWWKQLVWIAIYPPPLGKQILDALPPVIWVIGGLLMADGLWHLLTKGRPTNIRFSLFLMLGAVLTFCSLIYCEEIAWPDFYHINYGFPFAWVTRTLSTITGPVDYFKVNFSMLVVNIIFWFIVTLAAFWSWSKIRVKKVGYTLK